MEEGTELGNADFNLHLGQGWCGNIRLFGVLAVSASAR